jgi:hypothetical protein
MFLQKVRRAKSTVARLLKEIHGGRTWQTWGLQKWLDKHKAAGLIISFQVIPNGDDIMKYDASSIEWASKIKLTKPMPIGPRKK